jgi:dipeptidyl aminopeptidase/acylaminoacyl peptidase
MRSFVSSLLAASLFVAALAPAQPPSAAHLDELLASLSRGHRVGQVAVSPDGKRLAWVQGGEIRLAPIEDLARSRRVTALSSTGTLCREGQLAWAPDSAALAFVSDCASPDAQDDLYIDRLDGRAPRRITKLSGNADSPAFAPDGRSIAFLYVPGATRPAGALAAMSLPSGVIGEDGIEVQRVAIASAAAPEPAAPAIVSPAGLHVYEFDWAPTSKALAYIAADPPGENNWWVAKLYTQALDGAPTPILAPASVSGALHGLQMAVPRWSPDGKSIAFIGGLMSDQGVTGGDVWLVPSAGGDPVNLTPGRPASVEWIAWDDSRNIYLSELAGGDSRLARLHLSDDPAASATSSSTLFHIPATVRSGRLEMSLSPTADRSLFVFGASSFSAPPEIFAARAKQPASTPIADAAPIVQLSHFNQGLQPAWGRAESLNWTSDGFHVQGWLLLPKDYDPAQKYPMIVEVHGGPSASETPRWGGAYALSPAAFSALGYFVLMPNPRGSFGQGEAFTQANRKDFGYGDLRDILAGVDAVTAKYPVDPHRVGLTGWSYGGFMTMFAITQTHRFRAAVAGAGISDWLSYYGENSIDQWMIPFFGASVYDDPAAYAKSSAITFIKQASTPTLVVVGDRDGECPAPQSFEFWHALRDLHVPSRLVVYPNEGHGFSDPAHARDVLERAIDWFARYMPPAP